MRARRASPFFSRRSATLAVLAATLVVAAAAAISPSFVVDGKHGQHGGGGKKKKRPAPFCKGRTCQAMSDLLPTLAFAAGEGPTIFCSCADFDAGRCFAPGCSVCASACFDDVPWLRKLSGPFGTGLLCSEGCLPCCQAPDDPERVAGSTCELPPGGC